MAPCSPLLAPRWVISSHPRLYGPAGPLQPLMWDYETWAHPKNWTGSAENLRPSGRLKTLLVQMSHRKRQESRTDCLHDDHQALFPAPATVTLPLVISFAGSTARSGTNWIRVGGSILLFMQRLGCRLCPTRAKASTASSHSRPDCFYHQKAFRFSRAAD
jgi:hypothetical protein